MNQEEQNKAAQEEFDKLSDEEKAAVIYNQWVGSLIRLAQVGQHYGFISEQGESIEAKIDNDLIQISIRVSPSNIIYMPKQPEKKIIV